MENSIEKPKKKKFSLFCCFSLNEKGRKRKNQKYFSQNNISKTDKTNISNQNLNINIKGFSIEENSQNLKKNQDNNSFSISKVKEDLKNYEKIIKKENETVHDINLKKISTIKTYNNSLNKFHTLNEFINKNEEQGNYFHSKNSNIHQKKMSLNENKNEQNKNYELADSEFIDNNLFQNKEILDEPKNNETFKIENISINTQKNSKNIGFDESLSIIEKIKKNTNLNNKENYDTVNIYDNNNNSLNISLNKTNKIEEIKLNETQNCKINPELKLSKNNNSTIKNKIIKQNIKDRTDSMILNNYYDSDFRINSNIIKGKQNSSICVPVSKQKLNISKIIKNNQKENIISVDNKMDILNKIDNDKNIEKNSIYSYVSKKIKYSNSLKILNYVKIEKLGKEIDYSNKTGIFSLKSFDDNKIKYNFNFERKKYRKIRKVKTCENKNINDNQLDKEQTISINYKNINKNIDLNQNIISDISPNEIDNNLNYIDHEKYFGNKSEKEENFIIENANSEKNNTHTKEENNFYNERIKINNIKNDLEIEKEKMKEEDDKIKELEGDIEEEHESDQESKKINDSKSIISNYVVAPLIGIQDIKSYAPSMYSKSEFKDNFSNIIDLSSNKPAGIFLTPGINETEIEIMNENGKDFKSFIETPRASGVYNKGFTHKNINYNTINSNINNNYYYTKFCSTNNKSMNYKLKNIYDKINNTTKEIKKLNERIMNIDERIQTYEEYNKKYELWIQKEEEENELLINMLNFLINNRK